MWGWEDRCVNTDDDARREGFLNTCCCSSFTTPFMLKTSTTFFFLDLSTYFPPFHFLQFHLNPLFFPSLPSIWN